MLLILHIVIALSTLGLSSWLYFKPAQNLLKVNYFAAGLTLATGVILTILNPAHLVQTCITGIVYFTVVSGLTYAARHKLAD